MDDRIKQLTGDEQKVIWENNSEEFKGSVIAELIFKKIKSFLGNNIIDLGAGDGSFVKLINKKTKSNIIGVDSVPRSRFVTKGDITKTSFNSAEFDTFISTDVIEHLSDNDLKLVVKEMNRILKIGGCGIITTLYNENLENSSVICPCCKTKFHKWGHCQSFNKKNITNIFNNNGFEIKILKPISFSLLLEHPIFSRFRYFLNLDSFLVKKHPFVNKDLFIIVKKIRNVKN